MSRKNNKRKLKKIVIEILILLVIVLIGYLNPIEQKTGNDINNVQMENSISNVQTENIKNDAQNENTVSYNLSDIPKYEGKPYVTINNNKPYFSEADYTTESFEKYSKLDSRLGRCGVAYANICKEIMPAKNEKRDALSYNPTGWKQKKYKGLVDGDYLYNRCHLIGWQLAGENNNAQNLITGTRYLNIEGMLPFEDQVDDYFEKKVNENNHVLYRVTPIFEGNNLVASGVQMEAYSVEDNGKGVCFNVYAYNVQPGIAINYKTGESWLEK